MKWLVFLIWGCTGCVLAGLFLTMQRWTVNQLNPQRVKQGKLLVVGGAVLRWAIFSIVIILALRQSIAAAMSVFFTFLAARILLVMKMSQVSPANPGENP